MKNEGDRRGDESRRNNAENGGGECINFGTILIQNLEKLHSEPSVCSCAQVMLPQCSGAQNDAMLFALER